jgi:hypothetical protein
LNGASAAEGAGWITWIFRRSTAAEVPLSLRAHLIASLVISVQCFDSALESPSLAIKFQARVTTLASRVFRSRPTATSVFSRRKRIISGRISRLLFRSRELHMRVTSADEKLPAAVFRKAAGHQAQEVDRLMQLFRYDSISADSTMT